MCYNVVMIVRVGIRDLKQNASAVVKRVEAGETVEITDRGRPVARMVPLRHASAYDRLVAEGKITPAHGSVLDHRPLPPLPGRPLGSEALAELRADER
jgi:prevent-host-death family protein